MTPSNLRKNVMRRVFFVHRVRPFLRGGVFSLALLTFSLFTIGREVFVAQVFRNMPSPSHLLALGQFILAAFENTQVTVQLLSVVSVVAFMWLVKETITFFTPREGYRANSFA